jgi:hypothetical protein
MNLVLLKNITVMGIHWGAYSGMFVSDPLSSLPTFILQ